MDNVSVPLDENKAGAYGINSGRAEDEEAFQASLKGRHYEMFNMMNERNPDKAREVFNSFFQLNKQIDVSDTQV